MYLSRFRKYRGMLASYGFNLAEALKKFADAGAVELMTCAATHGFLPLMEPCEGAVRAQVQTAVQAHQAAFGTPPQGFWLPECAYQPGQDRFLRECGIRYFLVETHGLLYAEPRPRYGTFAPVLCPSGVAVFGRDYESAKQVWSSKEGYPGDPDYREFYRDAGFDLDASYVQSHIPSAGVRKFTGLKYYRVTGPGESKEPYDPERGTRKAEIHAEDFLRKKRGQAERVGKSMDRPPLILGMYDAELFGHWWYEGPDFLAFLFEKIAGQEEIQLITPSDYLEKHPENQHSTPAYSTWGDGGYSEFWLNPSNDWIYPPLLDACRRMQALAGQYPEAGGLAERALNQACRELLLAQSSDWAFMMKTGHHRDYAVRRFKSHLASFERLCDQVESHKIDKLFLGGLEERDNLFPRMDYRVFKGP
jgi:1,4-alpha-glucan branching enzyme